jgi:hypothetical protein
MMGKKFDESLVATKIGQGRIRPPSNRERFNMGDMTAKPKSPSGAIVRRRRAAVAAFRRDRRTEDDARAVPDWGRIVLRSNTTTLR